MSLLDVIYPKKCLGCSKSGGYICKSCLLKVKRPVPVCPVCEKKSLDGLTHVKCKRPQSLDGLVNIWEYKGVVRKAILALKYKFADEIIKELSKAVIWSLEKDKLFLPKKALLLPMSLHRRRKNWRGFNQVVEIGKTVSWKFGWGFDDQILVRKKYRRPQTELRGDERAKNIRGVFVLNAGNRQLITENRQLIIFDDVYTTGSTMKEAAKVLKRNGAKEVWGFTLSK